VRVEKLASEDRIDVLIFRVDGRLLCLSAHFVNRIIPLVHIEPIRNSANFVVGKTIINAEPIEVFDLTERLGKRRKYGYAMDASLLLLNNSGAKKAFVVDSIEDVVSISCSSKTDVVHPVVLEKYGQVLMISDLEVVVDYAQCGMETDLVINLGNE